MTVRISDHRTNGLNVYCIVKPKAFKHYLATIVAVRIPKRRTNDLKVYFIARIQVFKHEEAAFVTVRTLRHHNNELNVHFVVKKGFLTTNICLFLPFPFLLNTIILLGTLYYTKTPKLVPRESCDVTNIH